MTPRIAPLTPAERTEDQRRLIAAAGAELNIFTTFARHPKLFDPFTHFAGRLLRRSTLPDHVRETLILRPPYPCRAGYEWAHHVEIARDLGMPAGVITAIGTDHPESSDPHLILLLTAADQLVTNHDLDDPIWSALRELYDDQRLIELCMLVGNYAMIAGVLNSLRVSLENGYTAPDWS